MRALWASIAFIPSIAAATPVQLHHQGRLLDASGAPRAGSHSLSLALYDAAEGGELVHAQTASVALTDGFYTAAITVDSADLVQDLWLQIEIDGASTGPRAPIVSVPRAAVATELDGGAVRTSGIVVEGSGGVRLGSDTSTTCSGDGTIAYDPDAASVKLCVAGAWQHLAPQVSIRETGGVRRWSTGALASSCEAYRRPGTGYGYVGDTGDGLYEILPAGGTALTVRCDMTRDGGGWTLALASADRAHRSGNYNDFWYTTALRGPTLDLLPTALIETNGLLQRAGFFSRVRFTVDVDPDYTYVLDAGVWDGGTAEVNDPRFVRFNTGHNGQFWQGVATCSSGCHAALAIPRDGANINNGYYTIWGHTNGPPQYGLESSFGIDIWVR